MVFGCTPGMISEIRTEFRAGSSSCKTPKKIRVAPSSSSRAAEQPAAAAAAAVTSSAVATNNKHSSNAHLDGLAEGGEEGRHADEVLRGASCCCCPRGAVLFFCTVSAGTGKQSWRTRRTPAQPTQRKQASPSKLADIMVFFLKELKKGGGISDLLLLLGFGVIVAF